MFELSVDIWDRCRARDIRRRNPVARYHGMFLGTKEMDIYFLLTRMHQLRGLILLSIAIFLRGTIVRPL